MLARHAESMFWAGRQIERAESTARMLDVTYHGLLESPPSEARQSWLDLLAVLHMRSAFEAGHDQLTAPAVSSFLVSDTTNQGAVVSAVGAARENARSVRELLSTEVWESINTFWLELQARDLGDDLEQQPYELYGLVKRRCQAVAGTATETMPRDDGWRFLMLGWMLERAEMTCRLLDVRYSQLVTAGATGGFHHWLQTLKSASGSEAFRRHHRGSMDPADVVEFLLLSRTFPRSVLFCLRSAETDLARLEAGSSELTRPQRLLGRTRSDLEFLDPHELLEGGLHVFLDQLLHGIGQVAEAVGLQYFRAAAETDLHALGLSMPIVPEAVGR
jgi:uncharacterized alpha-E superfamily protein